MNPLHQKRPRPIDSPRGGFFPPDPYGSHPLPLPSTPTSVASMGSLGPPYMQTPPTSSPHPGNGGGGHGSSSSFRNVSACNRCRLRKNRCDQQLPACSSCEKAHVKCVGYDPITKREIPRAYVYYLERRTGYLEGLLRGAGIPYAPPEDFDVGPEDAHAQPTGQAVNPVGTGDIATRRGGFGAQGQGTTTHHGENVLKLRERSQSPVSPRTTIASSVRDEDDKGSRERADKLDVKVEPSEDEKLDKLVSNIGLVSVQGASDPRYLGSASGISFARVVFAAVRSSISGASGDRARGSGPKVKDASSPSAREGGGAAAAVSGSSMRDSFFGLQSRPAFKKAAFPDKELGKRLVDLYFEHANPQIPILHRGEYMSLFDKAYAASEGDRPRTAREQYMLNIVFAIGASIFLGAPDGKDENAVSHDSFQNPTTPAAKRLKFERVLTQPEEYHASAMAHLENFLGSAPASDRPEGFGGSLEELQAVLLLAEFALHRPVAPGLWYIVGVAVRLAVDLGLHHEDGTALDDMPGGEKSVALRGTGFHQSNINSRERGRREWVRDLRRRLWWCTYSFDRLVSTCVGRPFGITDMVVTTEFPSILDDRFITTSGFIGPQDAKQRPSYKRVSRHYFRLRMLQSEILQVLQHRSAMQARQNRVNQRGNATTHDDFLDNLHVPFIQRFDNNFNAWRKDVDRRLYEWKKAIPTQAETEVLFTTELLELNYWQAVIMLYRQSLTVPAELHRDAAAGGDATSPMSDETKGSHDDLDKDQETEEEIFLKVAEASQKVLYLYKKLHTVRLVNYTFLATHHLFMAGIAFLYAIWHSETVRSQLLFEEVDFTVLAAISVLTDLIEKCPPAEACRDAFDRMARATVKMCQNTTGFGSARPQQNLRPEMPHQHSAPGCGSNIPTIEAPHQFLTHAQSDVDLVRHERPRPHFDMNLRELFPEETPESQRFRRVSVWNIPFEPANAPQGQPMSAQPNNTAMMSTQNMPPQVNFGASPVTEFRGNEQAMQAQQQQAMLAQMQQQQAQSIPIHQAMGAPPSNFPGNFMPGTGFDTNMTYRNDIDSLLADSTQSYTGQPGLSLGFDSEHDWNDGAGVDLFDGYFFGGWNGGNMQQMQGPPGIPGSGPMDMQMEGLGPRDM